LRDDAVLGVRGEDVGLAEVGVHLDLVDGGDDGRGVEGRARWSGVKLLTPMARTFPSVRSVSMPLRGSSSPPSPRNGWLDCAGRGG
jgi:hypothetical protein